MLLKKGRSFCYYLLLLSGHSWDNLIENTAHEVLFSLWEFQLVINKLTETIWCPWLHCARTASTLYRESCASGMSFWKYTLQIHRRLGPCLQHRVTGINEGPEHKPHIKAQPIHWFSLKFVENNEQPDVDILHIWYRKRIFEMRKTGAIFPFSSVFLRLHTGTPWDKDVKQPPKETNSVPGCDCVNEQDGNSRQLPGCISKIVNSSRTGQIF